MSLTFEGDGTISGFDPGLSGFGGLVAVKSAIFTGTQTASLTAGSNVAVTDLSITHTLADAGNTLIIAAQFGAAATSLGRGQVGILFADDGSPVNVATSTGNRIPTTTGGATYATVGNFPVTYPSLIFTYSPGDTASHVYTVRAQNLHNSTRTLYINRTENDPDTSDYLRAVSSLVIQEVSV